MNWTDLDDKKKRLDALRPLPNELLKNLEDWFRVELTYTSNAIEGNTLTRQETAVVLEKGITVGGRTLKEHLEAVNHAQALDWLHAQASERHASVGENEILRLHEMILKGIDDANAGRYRSVAVRISGSTVVLPNPLKVPELMRRFATWLKAPSRLHPAEFAAQAHYRLVSIHPFVDGNGRTSRLLMNLLLMQHGFPPLFIRTRERVAYLNALEKAQLGGSLEDYEKLILKAADRSLDIYLNAAQGKVAPRAETPEERLLRIGVLAKKTGESPATLRYWTKEGLLKIEDHTESGYALYPLDAVEAVQHIREWQSERLSLQEIAQKVELRNPQNGSAKSMMYQDDQTHHWIQEDRMKPGKKTRPIKKAPGAMKRKKLI
jgi:Fic family protein